MPLWRPSAKSEDRPLASSSQDRPRVRLEVKLTGLYPIKKGLGLIIFKIKKNTHFLKLNFKIKINLII